MFFNFFEFFYYSFENDVTWVRRNGTRNKISLYLVFFLSRPSVAWNSGRTVFLISSQFFFFRMPYLGWGDTVPGEIFIFISFSTCPNPVWLEIRAERYFQFFFNYFNNFSEFFWECSCKGELETVLGSKKLLSPFHPILVPFSQK